MSRRPRNQKNTTMQPLTAHVESLTHDARGVARLDGKVVFIDGALPDEDVLFTYRTQRKSFDEGTLMQLIHPSSARVKPNCVHFGLCGGCSLQHMDGEAQLAAKQKIMLDTLQHLGSVQPESVLPPLNGLQWGYRRKARLGVKYVTKKETILVGFREKRSGLLADLSRCEVLHPSVGNLLVELRALVGALAAYQQIPQIEVAVGDAGAALVFRHLVELNDADRELLRAFGQQHNTQVYLQAGGPDTVTLLWPDIASLSYRLPDYNIELFFSPNDFIQVNADINRKLVDHAITLLDPLPHERVLDLFCGLGNFTLPLARRAAHVVGVEGDAQLVQRARDNAQHNQITNTDFHAADLNQALGCAVWAQPGFDKILLDPPRTGALEIIRQLAQFNATRIVYVSCNPATLARDAHELVVSQGYRLLSAGVMDMFPHTTHVESIALFEKTKN
jgi:23S rRNA (uracil1939-C5)-methyltransferase